MTVPSAGLVGLRRALWLVRLGRPLHLVGGLAFHGLGLAAAVYAGVVLDWQIALWCQATITAVQLMTHYANDYYDRDTDARVAEPTRWSGGSGILAAGLVPERLVLGIALGFAGLSICTALGLARLSPAPAATLALVLLALAMAWSYSGPPLWLNRRGLGELTGALLVPGLSACLGYLVQVGRLDALIIVAVLPLCCQQFAMLLGVNFPDVAADGGVGKRTLVVCLGQNRAAVLTKVALALPYLLLPLLMAVGLPWGVALAVLGSLPLAIAQARRLDSGAASDPERWDAVGFWGIGLLMVTVALEAVALVALAS